MMNLDMTQFDYAKEKIPPEEGHYYDPPAQNHQIRY